MKNGMLEPGRLGASRTPQKHQRQFGSGVGGVQLARRCFELVPCPGYLFAVFFFNDPATNETYTLSLHDALPICRRRADRLPRRCRSRRRPAQSPARGRQDRKSTRLNSSHVEISYAVFCLKKKKKKTYVYHVFIKKKRKAM